MKQKNKKINTSRCLLTVLLVGSLSACGNKGDLYLPDDTPELSQSDSVQETQQSHEKKLQNN